MDYLVSCLAALALLVPPILAGRLLARLPLATSPRP